MDEQDFVLSVKVRLYGGGTATEAARALEAFPSTFDLPGDREVEILSARPSATRVSTATIPNRQEP